MITLNKSLVFRIGLHAAILHAHLLSIASAEREITGDIKQWHEELKFLKVMEVNAAMWKLAQVGLIKKQEDGRFLIYE